MPLMVPQTPRGVLVHGFLALLFRQWQTYIGSDVFKIYSTIVDDLTFGIILISFKTSQSIRSITKCISANSPCHLPSAFIRCAIIPGYI